MNNQAPKQIRKKVIKYLSWTSTVGSRYQGIFRISVFGTEFSTSKRLLAVMKMRRSRTDFIMKTKIPTKFSYMIMRKNSRYRVHNKEYPAKVPLHILKECVSWSSMTCTYNTSSHNDNKQLFSLYENKTHPKYCQQRLRSCSERLHIPSPINSWIEQKTESTEEQSTTHQKQAWWVRKQSKLLGLWFLMGIELSLLLKTFYSMWEQRMYQQYLPTMDILVFRSVRQIANCSLQQSVLVKLSPHWWKVAGGMRCLR